MGMDDHQIEAKIPRDFADFAGFAARELHAVADQLWDAWMAWQFFVGPNRWLMV